MSFIASDRGRPLFQIFSRVSSLRTAPFRRGQRMEVSGFLGTVVDIDLRYTTLQAEGRKILTPNSNLFTNVVSVFE